MNIVTKYLLFKYLKHFFIILSSLQLFFVGIDTIQVFQKLPNSANLQLLYMIYNTFFTLTMTLPLSLVFAWIVMLTSLIRNNELISFYALNISPKDILKPIILITASITIILMALQATPLAYSAEQKNKILKHTYFVNEKSNIFLKYDDYFIYFKKLYPLEKKATDIHIFKIKDNDLIETTVGKKAYYQNNKWYVIDTKIIKKPENIDWTKSKLDITNEKFLYTLKGFEPKIINNVYKAKVQFSITDAIRTILLLDNQDFNTNKIKAILYSQLIMPFFIIPVIILIFIFVTPSSRFFNASAFISLSIFFTISVWGIIFLLQKLAFGSVLLAEVAIILPLIILFLITYYLYHKRIQ